MLANLSPTLGAICTDQGALETFKDLINQYTHFNKVVEKFKSLATKKKLSHEQVLFLNNTLLDGASSVSVVILQSLGPIVERILRMMKSKRKEDQDTTKFLLKEICRDSDAIQEEFEKFISGASGLQVTAAEGEEEFLPIAEPDESEEAVPTDENLALESENRLLADLWNKRELADSLMEEADVFYERISSEENRVNLSQDIKVKIASFLESYKNIVQTFEEKDKLLAKAKNDVMFHIAKGEFLSQATLTLIVRLIYLFEAIITFSLSAIQLSGEAERTPTLACVIFGSAEMNYDTLDTMKEIVRHLEEAS